MYWSRRIYYQKTDCYRAPRYTELVKNVATSIPAARWLLVTLVLCVLNSTALEVFAFKSNKTPKRHIIAKIFSENIYMDQTGITFLHKRNIMNSIGKIEGSKKINLIINKKLLSLILEPLKVQYLEENKIYISDTEIRKLMQERETFKNNEYSDWVEKRDGYLKQINSPDVSSGDKYMLRYRLRLVVEKINRIDEQTDFRSKSSDKVKKMSEVGKMESCLKELRDIKLNRYMYDKYGGKIRLNHTTYFRSHLTLQPIDALFKSLKNLEENGDFAIFNDEIKTQFWAYLAPEYNHNFLKEADVEMILGLKNPFVMSLLARKKITFNNSPELLYTLRGHAIKIHERRHDLDAGVSSVAFSPDGKTLASGAIDGVINLWNPYNGKLIKKLELDITDDSKKWKKGVKSLLFTPDGKQIISGYGDYVIRVWNVANGEPVRLFKNGGYYVSISSDGSILAHSDMAYEKWEGKYQYLNGAKLIDLRTGKLLHKLYGHGNNVYSIALSPDGKLVATGSADETMILWNVSNGKRIKRDWHGTGTIRALSFTPDGSILAGSDGKTLRLWYMEKGKKSRVFIDKKIIASNELGQHDICSLSFSNDGKLLVYGNRASAGIFIWDLSTGKCLFRLHGHKRIRKINAVVFSPDDSLIVSGSDDGTVKIWRNPVLIK